ncbi:Mrp/NBP35 family ATP-binding protein [Jiangella muralis]|uniref:Mrp/NBP35 family ATP-binding protein n=1 Tax=Jiangella muralis TaxID=702383 RepID=UPI00069F2AE0|nr:P-loop NTPase [Jiangella muralis]
MSALPTVDDVTAALAGVKDPEIKRPITELNMVKSVDVAADGRVTVAVYLTVSGCPLRDTIIRDVTAAVMALQGSTSVEVVLDVMSAEQRKELSQQLRGGAPEREIPFTKPDSLTRIYAVASGKGGVGKSSVTANLAAAMAADGVRVGLVDADIYGHSIPRMFGVEGSQPTVVERMIMPVPAHGVKLISTEMFKPDRDIPVAWRGPMLHRALQQFLTDVYWGDLDILLLDLPPGTGDVAISLAQLLPNAEIVVVTTPQLAAAEVAERAGSIAMQTHQQVAGVIENMSFLPCPHCGPEHRLELFGSGGGQRVADGLSKRLGAAVPLLGEIPIDTRLREGGDTGTPLVLDEPDLPASITLRQVAKRLSHRQRGLAGMSLSLSPAG